MNFMRAVKEQKVWQSFLHLWLIYIICRNGIGAMRQHEGKYCILESFFKFHFENEQWILRPQV